MDAKHANMSRKQLNSLSFSWDRNEEFELQENVGEILEALQPDTQQLQIQTKNERATNWNDNISHRGLSEKRIPCSLIALGIKIERQSKQKLIEFARELRSFPSIDMSELCKPFKLASSNKKVDLPKEFIHLLCWQGKRVSFGRIRTTEIKRKSSHYALEKLKSVTYAKEANMPSK
ncbi:hypothetical protein JHK86_000364 [Glycine max]|nr:hypothetical protein JHK86_000364 [Glycine max]